MATQFKDAPQPMFIVNSSSFRRCQQSNHRMPLLGFQKSIELRIIVAELTPEKVISGSEIGLYLLKNEDLFSGFRKNRFFRTWRAKGKDPRVFY